MRADGDPQRGWAAAKDLRWRRCEDCDLRGDLDSLGRPLTSRRHRIAECETCSTPGKRGTGAVPSIDTIDPYVTGQK